MPLLNSVHVIIGIVALGCLIHYSIVRFCSISRIFDICISHLLIFKMPISLNCDHVIYFFLLVLDIIYHASVSLLHASKIGEDIVLRSHSLIIEDLSVHVLCHFLIGVKIMNHIHFFLFLLVHIVNEFVPFLHVPNSLVRFFLFFLELNDSGTNTNLLILDLLLSIYSLHHLSVSAWSNRRESGHQRLPLLSTTSSSPKN